MPKTTDEKGNYGMLTQEESKRNPKKEIASLKDEFQQGRRVGVISSVQVINRGVGISRGSPRNDGEARRLVSSYREKGGLSS